MTKDHPVVGVGAGNFVDVEPRYATRDIDLRRVDLIVDTPKGAHNTYLHTLTELGVIGLLLLLAAVLGCLTICFRAVRALERAGERELGLLGRAVIVGDHRDARRLRLHLGGAPRAAVAAAGRRGVVLDAGAMRR